MPTIGEVIGEKYRVVRMLGAGGMGVVYEALNLATEKPVALKCLHPDMARVREAPERLKREAKATGRINHPNVVAVHDCGEHAGMLYLVIELLQGSSLRAWLDGRRLAPDEMCRVLYPVMRGVAAAHAVGVLHRDLKPENIFLSESPDGLEPVPKVLDFGLARFRDGQTYATLSVAGALMGTYQYMAPEQLRNHPELDERVDVYALGVLAYEMLTGELPYRADNPIDLALRILESEAPLVSARVAALPHGLGLTLARALSRDREERYASVDAFAEALTPYAGGQLFRGRTPSSGRAVASVSATHEPPPAASGSTALGSSFQQPAGVRELTRFRWAAGAIALLGLTALTFALTRAPAAVAPSAARNGAGSQAHDQPASIPAQPARAAPLRALHDAAAEAIGTSHEDWALGPATTPPTAGEPSFDTSSPLRPEAGRDLPPFELQVSLAKADAGSPNARAPRPSVSSSPRITLPKPSEPAERPAKRASPEAAGTRARSGQASSKLRFDDF